MITPETLEQGGLSEPLIGLPVEGEAEVIILEDYRQAHIAEAGSETAAPTDETEETQSRYLDYIRVKAARSDPNKFEALLEEYMGFIKYLTKKYFIVGADSDDLFQEATFGFYKAVRDYDGVSSNFINFTELCVTRQVITAVKTANRYKHTALNDYLSFYDRVPGAEDEEIDFRLRSALVSPGPLVEELVGSKVALPGLVEFMRTSLSPLEIEALRGYLEGDTYKETAAKLNGDSKRIDNALQRARRKILMFLSESGVNVFPIPYRNDDISPQLKTDQDETETLSTNEVVEQESSDVLAELSLIYASTIDPIELAGQALIKLKAHGHSGVLPGRPIEDPA